MKPRPPPVTDAEVRAHGSETCFACERCRVCCALNRQLIDAIREMRGQSALYEANDYHEGRRIPPLLAPTYPAPWERPLDGRRWVA